LLKHGLACGLLLVCVAGAALAENAGGTLKGAIIDPHKAQVAGAAIKVTNLATQKVYQTRSDAQGNYEVTGLPAGAYSIEVVADNFKLAKVNSVHVRDSGEVVWDVGLTVAGMSQRVDVHSLAMETEVKTLTPTALVGLVEGVKNDTVVFTSSDIEALHPQSLVEVLQQVPGVEATFQGRQHMDFVSLRGGSFQVILDGVYMSQSDRLLATIPVESIESMTIVRDSTALSVGPLVSFQAMGGGSTGVGNQGFVIIKTKRASEPEMGFVSNGGTYDTAMGQLYAGSKSGNWDYRGDYTYMTSAGRDGWNMGYRNGAATFHGGYTGGNTNVDFLYYGSRGMRDMEYGEVLMPAGATCQYGSGPNYGQNYHAPYGTLCQSTFNLDYQNANLFATNVSHAWNDKNRTVLQYGFTGLDVSGNHTPQNNTEGDFDLKHTILILGQEVTAGVQFIKYIAPAATAPSTGSRTDQALASWYVQDQFPLLKHRLIVDGGIRGDKTHNNWNSTLKTKVDDWSTEYPTLALGASYLATTKATVDARFGYVDSPVASNYWFQSSSGLQASSMLPNQKQDRGELGMDYKVNPYFKPRVSIYMYDTAHGIATYSATCTTPAGAVPPNKKNQTSWYDSAGNEQICVASAGSVKTAGTEVGFSGRIVKPLEYNAGYGFIATTNKANNGAMSHNFVDAGLRFHRKQYFGDFTMVYVGPRSISTSPIGTIYYELGNYTRYDLNTGVNFKAGTMPMTFTVFGRNLGDNNYATRYVTGAYLDPGRTIGIQLAGRVF
jgi:iron complex outermembrane receptor protein